MGEVLLGGAEIIGKATVSLKPIPVWVMTNTAGNLEPTMQSPGSSTVWRESFSGALAGLSLWSPFFKKIITR